MSTPSKPTDPHLPIPANDNSRPAKTLRAELRFPEVLPIQIVEVEVFASLLDDLMALVANDNQDEPE
ncbi:MAG TPA: hypothetical protein VMJ73_11295 [Rhizomicrobium sp.]|nr:hypothetical protein [Rhizomicrobium sp.]